MLNSQTVSAILSFFLGGTQDIVAGDGESSDTGQPVVDIALMEANPSPKSNRFSGVIAESSLKRQRTLEYNKCSRFISLN